MPFLNSYQLRAINDLQNGNILNGGVGSGKSRASLAYFFKINGGDPMDRVNKKMINPCDLYIITTAKKRDDLDWEEEMAPFFPKGVYNFKIVVDSWNNIKKYTDVQNGFFIFDEQRVVGNGAWVKSFIKISRNNKWILLSATPGDTWMDYIPVFIANGFYRNRTEFISEHVKYKPYTSFPVVDRYYNTGRLIRLRNKILVDMKDYRETIRHHQTINCKYNISKYKEVIKTRWNPFTDEPITSASEYCQVLRKIVAVDESRREEILNLFKHHEKIIVFYNYNYELELLKMIDWGEDVEIAEWNGHKHQPIPGCSKWVYLVQYNAGSEGWNCIRTNALVFFSDNYSYKIMEQASGRIDRMNTPYRDLYYYHLRTKSSIELSIVRALKEKKKFNERKFSI